jgi:response regulator RpfG family c-di-GMP phosphodiesterase
MQPEGGTQKPSEKAERREKPRIIVVDDDGTILHHTAEAIRQSFKNAEILAFDDAALAWQELLRISPDLLVTDFYHCTPTGEEMLTSLAEQRANFPVLVLFGTAKEEQVRRCAGPNLRVSLLGKPWTKNQLYGELSKLLGRGGNPP